MSSPEPLRSPTADDDPSSRSDTALKDGADASADAGQPLEDGWLDRLKSTFGMRANGTLRDSIEDALTRDEASDSQFSPEERLLLRNILRLREIRIDDVMVPRADIDAVDAETSLADLLRLFLESGHSRMPVYLETLDDPRGLVHIKDLMAFITEATGVSEPAADDGDGEAGFNLGHIDLSVPLSSTGLIRSILFVPPSMRALDLMAKMQASRMQMALVIDEYGGTDGLVSLEDLVEEVVGDIEDEHDDGDEPGIDAAGEGTWIADARIYLEDVTEIIGDDFEIGDLGEEVDTLGGLVFTMIGRIPVRGELVSSPQLPCFEFEVLDADPRRIKRLRVMRRRDGRLAGDVRRRTRRPDVTESAPVEEKDA